MSSSKQEGLIDFLREHFLGNDLTQKKAEQLLFESFRFSQGNVDLQKEILTYLHSKHPKWSISDDMKGYLLTTLQLRVEAFILRDYELDIPTLHKQIATTDEKSKSFIEDQLVMMTDFMQTVFVSGGLDGTEREDLIANIATNIIHRDNKFIVISPGRERGIFTEEPGLSGSANDQWLSHVCYYGLEGHKTGFKEYDDMFLDVSTYIKTHLYPPNRRSDSNTSAFIAFRALSDVVNVYNEHHRSTIVLPR